MVRVAFDKEMNCDRMEMAAFDNKEINCVRMEMVASNKQTKEH